MRPLSATGSISGMWFSNQGYPLVPDDIQGWGTNLVRVELHPLPSDSGFRGDSVLVVKFEDPAPRVVDWNVTASGEFGYPFSLKEKLQADSLHQATLRIPRLLFHPLEVGIHVFHETSYRGLSLYFRDSLPASALVVVWPPRDTVRARLPGYPGWTCVHDSTRAGLLRSTCIESANSGTPRFHRSLSREGSRVAEDSGSWDSATGMARFRERSMGTSERTDSTFFRVYELAKSGGCWFTADPPLEQVAWMDWQNIPWRFFASPSTP